MPLKDDVAKYYAQGKEAVTEYVDSYKDKEKHRKDVKEQEKEKSAAQEAVTTDDTTTTAGTATSSTSTAVGGASAQDTEVIAVDTARSTSALGRYKDRLAIKLPTGQFDIENATAVPLNISLNHVGPIYYDTVKPGEGEFRKSGVYAAQADMESTVFSRQTGKVWFTVEVRLHLGPASEYNKWSVAWPIMLVAGPSAAAISLAAIPLVMLSTGAITVGALATAAAQGVSTAFATVSSALGIANRLPFVSKYKRKAIQGAQAQGQEVQKFAGEVMTNFQQKGGIQGVLEHLKSKGGEPKLIEMPEQPLSVHDITDASLAELFDTHGPGPKGWKKSRWRKLAKALEEVKLVDRGWYAGREPNLRVTGGPRIVEIDNTLPKKHGEKRTILEIWPLRLEKVVEVEGELVSEELARGEGEARDVKETVREAAEELRGEEEDREEKTGTRAEKGSDQK